MGGEEKRGEERRGEVRRRGERGRRRRGSGVNFEIGFCLRS